MTTHAIYKYMSPAPQSIGRDQPLRVAHKMMREHHVRHLPVLDAGVLVGIVSDRDLYFVETLRDVDPNDVKVEDAMTPEPDFVAIDTPLRDVAAKMAQTKHGSVIVLDRDRVVGIFTTVDALRALIALDEETRGDRTGRNERPLHGPTPSP
jgi:acetoin utilization protein AcuB